MSQSPILTHILTHTHTHTHMDMRMYISRAHIHTHIHVLSMTLSCPKSKSKPFQSSAFTFHFTHSHTHTHTHTHQYTHTGLFLSRSSVLLSPACSRRREEARISTIQREGEGRVGRKRQLETSGHPSTRNRKKHTKHSRTRRRTATHFCGRDKRDCVLCVCLCVSE